MRTQKLYYTKYFCPQTLQILVAADFAGVKIQSLEINKKYDSVSLVTSDGVLNRSNAILKYLATSTNLNGSTQTERNQLNTWFEYFNTQIFPVLTELYAQILGEKQPSQTKFTYCLQQITKNLKVLDQCLKIKTFFVGNNLTLFDISLTCYLENLFKLIITQSERKKFINLFRWYNYVRDIPVFVKYYGKKILCGKDAFKIQFSGEKNQDKFEQTNEVKNQKKKEEKGGKKKQNKVQQKKEQSKKVEQKQEKTEQTAPQVGGFKFDDFKREFQNSTNQKQVLKNLLDNFPNEKLSIWKIHYLKDVTQGKVLFLTQNLANGSLQRIQQIRKNAFGSWGVFGQQGDYQIRGLMIWQGLQIHQAWKQHPAFQYHQFKKLSASSEQDRQIIYDYILEHECAQGLMNRSTKRIV